MTEKQPFQPNPDDRSDNKEKLENMIEDTIQNIEKSEETIENSSGDDKQQIIAKNNRRKEAIESFNEEIKDEYH